MSRRAHRGEYRSIHTVLVDGPDYQSLTPAARLTLLTVKLSLGPSQIGVLPAREAVLAERTGHPADVVRDALAELVAAGWVECEGNIIWIVRGLEFETSLAVSNANHRASVIAYLDGLPRLAIVGRFRARYAAWCQGHAIPHAMGDGIPHPTAITEDRRPKTEHEHETEDRRPKPTGGRAGMAPAVRVAVAANRGALANPETRAEAEVHPLGADRFEQRVADWLRLGIPLETIETAVEDVARRYRPVGNRRRITSAAYFDAAVREAGSGAKSSTVEARIRELQDRTEKLA